MYNTGKYMYVHVYRLDLVQLSGGKQLQLCTTRIISW